MSNPTPTSAHPRIPKRRIRQWRQRRADLPMRASGYIPDISEFQGAVDWDGLLNAYRSGTIQGVIMRAGFGTTRADYQFYRNRDSARARGIPRAFYWYNYPTYNSPGAEAATFNAVVGPLQPGEAMIGDFEESGLTASWGAAFLTATESPQANTLWYGSPYFVSQWGLGSLRASWQYWIADYGVSSPPMTNSPVMWQYTDRGYNQWDTSVMLSGQFTDLLIPGGPAPSPAPAQGALSNMGTICQHPTYANRYDRITLDPNSHLDGPAGRGYRVWRQWSDTPWFPNDRTGSIDTGGYLIPGTEYCWWEKSGAWCMFGGIGGDGMEYVLGVDINGTSVFGWGACGGNPLAPPLSIPQPGPKGDAGPTYDDTAVKARITTLEADLQKIKADIQ